MSKEQIKAVMWIILGIGTLIAALVLVTQTPEALRNLTSGSRDYMNLAAGSFLITLCFIAIVIRIVQAEINKD